MSDFDTEYTYNRIKKMQKISKNDTKKDFMVQNPHFILMEPFSRIKLPKDILAPDKQRINIHFINFFRHLLMKAGYTLSFANNYYLIIRYCVENKIYDLSKLNDC